MNEEHELAATAIIEFGYTHEVDDSLVKYKAGRPREKYQPVDGGFLRFTRDDGVWKPVALRVAGAFKGVSGLDMDNPEHAQFFDWVYPDDYLLNIYSTALLPED